MRHFPIFVQVTGERVILAGGGEAALAKLRLLLKTEARIEVYSGAPAGEIADWAAQGRLRLFRRDVTPADLTGARLAYGAQEDPRQDARLARLAQEAGVLFNIVDNLDASQFITPAIVDRDPVTVAIGTEGAAPVLARGLKADLEARLPASLGALARAARAFRGLAEALPFGAPRRAFWSEFFFRSGPDALEHRRDADLRAVLDAQLARHLGAAPSQGRLTFAVIASDDPELLPLRTRTVLHEADTVRHGPGISPAILDLARREAHFMPADGPAGKLIEAVSRGETVICLTGQAPDPALLSACLASGITPHVIPGIAPLSPLTALKETA